jgi:hypothetical protein
LGEGGLGSGRSKVHISDLWFMKHYVISFGVWLSNQVKYVIVLHGPLKAFLVQLSGQPRKILQTIWVLEYELKFHRKLKRKVELLK